MTANRLEEKVIQCPYCWESISVLVDCSVELQEYLEDCQVCCRPIIFDVSVDEEGLSSVTVSGDDS